MSPSSAPPDLECPGCGRRYGGDAGRFCEACGMPLVLVGVEPDPVDARREWARKVKPQLAEGHLVRVVGARNQAEAEFIAGMLLEEGVPSLVRRSAGFDVPDFLAAGPRDILVPQSGEDVARAVLLQAELIAGDSERVTASDPRAAWRLLAGLLAALAVGAAVVWLLSSLS